MGRTINSMGPDLFCPVSTTTLHHRVGGTRKSSLSFSRNAAPIAALAAAFPLNAHLALYGSYWSSLVWLLVALACAPPLSTRPEVPV
jgi:hypothetical protein